MAGVLKVDDLRGNTTAGDITITSEGGSATMQLQQGLLKSWANYDNNTSLSLKDSLNVSSGTDVTTGNTRVSFSSSFSNANYCVTFGTGDQGRTWSASHALASTSTTSPNTKTTSNTQLHTTGGTISTQYDLDENNLMMSGDLA